MFGWEDAMQWLRTTGRGWGEFATAVRDEFLPGCRVRDEGWLLAQDEVQQRRADQAAANRGFQG